MKLILKIKILILVAIITVTFCFSEKNPQIKETNNNKAGDYKKEIEYLNREIEYLKESHQLQSNIFDKTISSISTQISGANNYLQIFSIIIAITGIGLSIYVTRIWNKIESMSSTNEEYLKTSKEIQLNVRAINNEIHNDIEKLYRRLQREETLYILKRLEEVPEDIANTSQILLTRKLLIEDYHLIKVAFKKMKEIDIKYSNTRYIKSYYVVFFQHFIAEFISENEFLNEHKEMISIGVESSFNNDIKASLKQVVILINKKGVKDFESQITHLLSQIHSSKFKEDTAVYESFLTQLHNTEHFQEIWNILKSMPNFNITLEKLKLKYFPMA